MSRGCSPANTRFFIHGHITRCTVISRKYRQRTVVATELDRPLAPAIKPLAWSCLAFWIWAFSSRSTWSLACSTSCSATLRSRPGTTAECITRSKSRWDSARSWCFIWEFVRTLIVAQCHNWIYLVDWGTTHGLAELWTTGARQQNSHVLGSINSPASASQEM